MSENRTAENTWTCQQCGRRYAPYGTGTHRSGPKAGRRIMSTTCKSCRMDDEN